MSEPPDSDPMDHEAQLTVAREVIERRREFLRDMAIAEEIMERDREILRALAKS